MNDITTINNNTTLYKQDFALASEIDKIVKGHNLSSKILVYENDTEYKKKNGVYLLIAPNDNELTKLSSLNVDELYIESKYKKENDVSIVLPKGFVYKMDSDDGLYIFSSMIENIQACELLNEKFKEYNGKLPDKMSGTDFATILYLYNRSINLSIPAAERNFFTIQLKYVIGLISSGMKEMDYLQKMKNSKDGFDYMHRINQLQNKSKVPTKEYYSKSKNNKTIKELEEIGEIKKVNIKNEALKQFEKELADYDVFYNIEPVSKAVTKLNAESILTSSFASEKNNDYYHLITFNKKDEAIISSVMHMATYPEINKKAEYLINNPTKPKFGLALPAADFDNFSKFAKYYNLDFVFDCNNVYVKSNINEIGIVVNTRQDFITLNKCLKDMYDCKMKAKFIDREKEKEALDLAKSEENLLYEKN